MRLKEVRKKVVVNGVLVLAAVWLAYTLMLEFVFGRIPVRAIKKLGGWITFPRSVTCARCGVPKCYAEWHITPGAAHPMSASNVARVFGCGLYCYDADSPLCEACWQDLPASECIPYYEAWIESRRERVAYELGRPYFAGTNSGWVTPQVDDWRVESNINDLKEWAAELAYI